jgi:Flp pilus assembly protein TadD
MANALHPLVVRGRDALARGDLRAVEAAADERLRLAGRDINALELRYLVQKSRGHFTEAARTLQNIISIDSRADWAFNELIELLRRHGKRTDAEQVARTALRTNPNNAQANSLFGSLLSEGDNLPAGEWHLRRALELSAASTPDAPAETPPGPTAASQTTATFVSLGINLMKQGRMEDADAAFTRAHELSAEDVNILTQWARLQIATGNVGRAQELLNSAQALLTARTQAPLPLGHGATDPKTAAQAAAHNGITRSLSQVALLRADVLSRTGRHEQALAVLEESGDTSVDARLARGRLLERLGRYEGAWREFLEAKRKVATDAGGLQYRADAIEAFFEKLKQFFTRDHVARLPRASRRTDTPQPIFILAFPRSGSALLERLLSSHPAIARGGELPFLSEFPKVCGHLLPGPDIFPSQLAQSWTADHRHVATVFRDYYLARAEHYGLFQAGKRFFTDRMPFNEIHVPLLRMAFPEARIVRMVRHPLDVCVSVLSSPVPPDFHSGYRIEDTAHHLAALFDLAEHYRRELEPGEMAVRYESLVQDPAKQIQRLLEQLGLQAEQKGPKPADIEAMAAHATAAGRHQHYAPWLKPVVPRLQKLMKAHDYF